MLGDEGCMCFVEGGYGVVGVGLVGEFVELGIVDFCSVFGSVMMVLEDFLVVVIGFE